MERTRRDEEGGRGAEGKGAWSESGGEGRLAGETSTREEGTGLSTRNEEGGGRLVGCRFGARRHGEKLRGGVMQGRRTTFSATYGRGGSTHRR